MSRTLLLHLSDPHLCQPADRAPKPALWDSLEHAVRSVAASADPERTALAITGDLVDSSKTPLEDARDAVLDLIERVRDAIGRRCPAVLLPGNHDRRSSGVLSPWASRLMGDLAGALESHDVTLFAPGERDALATMAPRLGALLDADVFVYDTTHTTVGCFSAGGLFRADDLFAMRELVRSRRPVIMLLHHHLVPTPVTDVELVDSRKEGRIADFLIQAVLPRVVAFGNREELTMTALGAGTAITALHSLGSAVLVLHGHKHYATSRLMKATTEGDGDVLIASAGSAGLLEPYVAAGPDEPAFLWPSFNAIWLSSGAVDVETVFFSPDTPKTPYRQPLASAEREGAKWKDRLVPAPAVVRDEIVSDTATFTLDKGAVGFWDLACQRLVVPAIAGLGPYREPLHTTKATELTGEGITRDDRGRSKIEIPLGVTVSYECDRGLFRTIDAAARELGHDAYSPFESIDMHVQRGTRRASMIVRGLGAASEGAFATLTDLHSGQQRPVRVEIDDEEVRVIVESCPARRLLRLFWPLEP